MAEHLFKNWMVYILLGGFIYFVAYLMISSRKKTEDDKGGNK